MRSPHPARSDVVVVGGGVAAGACVSSLRDAGYDGTVTVVCSEPHPPYTRPGLTKQVLRGEKPPDAALWRPGAWYGEQSVELRHGRDRDRDRSGRAHRVRGSTGRLAYGSLVLATGAEPRHLDFGPGVAGSRARAAVVRRRRRHPPAPRRGHALARDRRRVHRRRVRRFGRAHRERRHSRHAAAGHSRRCLRRRGRRVVRRPPAPARRSDPHRHDRHVHRCASGRVARAARGRSRAGGRSRRRRRGRESEHAPRRRCGPRARARRHRGLGEPPRRALPTCTRSGTSPPTRASCTGGA